MFVLTLFTVRMWAFHLTEEASEGGRTMASREIVEQQRRISHGYTDNSAPGPPPTGFDLHHNLHFPAGRRKIIINSKYDKINIRTILIV